jgi:hypothetical protein
MKVISEAKANETTTLEIEPVPDKFQRQNILRTVWTTTESLTSALNTKVVYEHTIPTHLHVVPATQFL